MPRTRIFLNLAAPFLLLLAGTVSALAQTAQSPLPNPTGYVNDYAGVVDGASKARMETTLGNLDRLHQIQFAVVVIDTAGGQDVFDYSLAVARGWGIGSKDTQKPSLLLLVAIKDRKGFTQVSRHLEGDLPDGLVGQIERERIIPAFRAGEYGRGLEETINAYIGVIALKRGFSTEPIFSPGTTRAAERSTRAPVRSTRRSSWLPCGIVIVLIVVLVGIIIKSRGRGGPGIGGGGNWGGLIAAMLINSLLSSGRGSRSSGWGGGGFGGFSGGGGSSGGGGGFGGFGGGGDFGGGGAGVSW
ncbi:MAG TPA: TPM domain-containing protein [Pyrinomonadaceae bacterium]|nr:TPM domain-containing protein [Pyrinomonadaceae bacterium]